MTQYLSSLNQITKVNFLLIKTDNYISMCLTSDPSLILKDDDCKSLFCLSAFYLSSMLVYFNFDMCVCVFPAFTVCHGHRNHVVTL